MPMSSLAPDTLRRFFRVGALALATAAAGCIAPPAPMAEAPTAPQAAPAPAPPAEPPGRIIFAGFAMHSQSKAFRNDVLLAEKLVRELDANALMLKLANPARGESAEWPQATVENFALVMSKMAEVVQPRDRVLLLISTHANPGLLNITVAGKNQPPITPRLLSDALAPLKVPTLVVLSACYSGAFIKPLRAPNRVVLTASDTRLTSFRCQYDGTHTPFAEALFGQADAENLSVTDWMDEARKSIAAQEKRRKLPASRPQAFIGEEAKVWADQPLKDWLQAP
ncbi:peptidase C13 [Acidovorax sp. Leaf76]|uniref:C13 family peptidase n=2 Tax=Acidovorax TaxID=12916 RepID=UPI0006FF3498|nr:C13 family peptidase [Acidovorax sp. Leaf76]KQO16531.1 peptidase C13 [Acidovorax sp. Leaf76]KQO32594.1 peptidase C13 [Acidovorax sp. Leaf84]KQS32166.1 peptidase C13 [Acidovorax sp. Leaf191]